MKSFSRQLDEIAAACHQCRVTIKSNSADPRMAHEAEERLQLMQRGAPEIVKERHDNLRLAASIRSSIDAFEKLPMKTAARSTALRKLREAAMWLEEEAGPSTGLTDPQHADQTDKVPVCSAAEKPAAKKAAKKKPAKKESAKKK